MPAFSYCRWGVIWKQWYDTNFIGNGTYQVSIRLSLDIVESRDLTYEMTKMGIVHGIVSSNHCNDIEAWEFLILYFFNLKIYN